VIGIRAGEPFRAPAGVPTGPPRHPLGDRSDRHIVAAALRTLSAEHRAVLRECYLRGASVSQAAATLGIPPGTVTSRAHYALRALRLAIEELGGAQ
jgi:RNA polymerase sigma-70 factor (ECF subfamily)